MLALKEEYLPNYTYDDYVLWEGNWELIDGIPYAMSPAPTVTHQEINGNILVALKTALKNVKAVRHFPKLTGKSQKTQ